MMWTFNSKWGSEHYCYFCPVFCSDCFYLHCHEGPKVERFDPVCYACVSVFQTAVFIFNYCLAAVVLYLVPNLQQAFLAELCYPLELKHWVNASVPAQLG